MVGRRGQTKIAERRGGGINKFNARAFVIYLSVHVLYRERLFGAAEFLFRNKRHIVPRNAIPRGLSQVRGKHSERNPQSPHRRQKPRCERCPQDFFAEIDAQAAVLLCDGRIFSNARHKTSRPCRQTYSGSQLLSNSPPDRKNAFLAASTSGYFVLPARDKGLHFKAVSVRGKSNPLLHKSASAKSGVSQSSNFPRYSGSLFITFTFISVPSASNSGIFCRQERQTLKPLRKHADIAVARAMFTVTGLPATSRTTS